MIRRGILFLTTLTLIGSVFGAEWVNITPETRVGGRMASCGYLKGKVVLLDVRDYSNGSDSKLTAQIQEIWSAYKSKPFVALGSHTGKDDLSEASSLVQKQNLTYSIYSNVALKDNSGCLERFTRGIYVFDPTGRRLYFGDNPRQAMGVVGSAIFAAALPSTPKYWKAILDYEIDNLPGQAYLRIRDLKNSKKDVLKKLSSEYPDDVKRYAKVWKEYSLNSEIKKLAKLVEITQLVKDRDKSSRAAKKVTVLSLENIIKQYSALSKSENLLVAQEAKNSIADLKFVQAELKR